MTQIALDGIPAESPPTVRLRTLETPLGPMRAGADERALYLLEFADRPMLRTQLNRVQQRFRAGLEEGDNAVLQQTQTELAEYFAGRRRVFSVPLEARGTPFQQRAWQALLAIPWGERRSYAEQAAVLGVPDALRAVGRANGDNRIAIIIPCHRLVGSDGRLTGYGGGVWRKQRLLELEQQ
jgi:O-6-methylguanine DNA methyltransferase